MGDFFAGGDARLLGVGEGGQGWGVWLGEGGVRGGGGVCGELGGYESVGGEEGGGGGGGVDVWS